MAEGTSSTRAKNKYNAKSYDRIALQVKKGKKEEYRKQAEAKGYSLNGYINMLLEKDRTGE